MTPKFDNLISEMAWKYQPSDRVLDNVSDLVKRPNAFNHNQKIVQYFIQQIRKNKKFAMWLAGAYVFYIEDVEDNKKNYDKDFKRHMRYADEYAEEEGSVYGDDYREHMINRLKRGIQPIPSPQPDIWDELEYQIPGLQWPPSADMVPSSGMPGPPRWFTRRANQRFAAM